MDEVSAPIGVTREEFVELKDMVAEIAEDVATGAASHFRTAENNRTLAVLKRLRPGPSAAEPVAEGQMCGKPQYKDNEESPVCLLATDHLQHGKGHQYGPRPTAAV